MLVAQDLTGFRVVAWEAQRGSDYLCPECAAGLVVKKGPIVCDHFAHRSEEACGYGEGESYQHEFMKYQFRRWWPDCELEVAGVTAGRRADVVIKAGPMPVVVECQATSQSVEEWITRTKDYRDQSVRLLWVWYSTLLTDHHPPREYRIPAAALRDASRQLDRLLVFRWPGELEIWDLVTPWREPRYVRRIARRNLLQEHDSPSLKDVLAALDAPRTVLPGPGREVALRPVDDVGHPVWRICDADDGSSMGAGLFVTRAAAADYCERRSWELIDEDFEADE